MLTSIAVLDADAHGAFTEDLEGVAFAWLEITQKCNLECVHCYADSGPGIDLHGAMDKNQWLRVIGELSEIGCRNIQFIGGEPLLHPSLREFILHARGLGIPYIEVFTNGTAVTDDWVSFFKMHAVKLAMSYYAADREVHEAVTTKAGSYDKTNAGLARLVNAGIPLRVELIDIEGLNSRSIEPARASLQSRGVQAIRVDRVRSIGRGSTCGEHAKPGSCGNCWNRRVCVTSSGTVFPCIMSRSDPIGNVRNAPLQDIVASEVTRSFRASYRLEKYLAKPPCGPTHGGCGPDGDQECSPDDGACGPDNCSPNDAGEDCGPDTR